MISLYIKYVTIQYSSVGDSMVNQKQKIPTSFVTSQTLLQSCTTECSYFWFGRR